MARAAQWAGSAFWNQNPSTALYEEPRERSSPVSFCAPRRTAFSLCPSVICLLYQLAQGPARPNENLDRRGKSDRPTPSGSA